jgi:hypothetical protein
MTTPNIYKRNGYEFQVVERVGNVSRAIGRKGKREIHDVTIASPHNNCTFAFSSEPEAVEKFSRITQVNAGEVAG